MNRFFQDKNGRLALWQWPSPLLWVWLIARVLARVLPDGALRDWCGYLGSAALLVWALLELATGVNYFRRLLGLVVIGLIVLQYLQP